MAWELPIRLPRVWTRGGLHFGKAHKTGVSNVYSATSFVISSKTPTTTARATRDWTQHFREGRGGHRVHSASHALHQHHNHGQYNAVCLAMPLQKQATQGELTARTLLWAGTPLPSMRKRGRHTCSHSLWELCGAAGNRCKESGGTHLKSAHKASYHTRLRMAGGQGCRGVHQPVSSTGSSLPQRASHCRASSEMSFSRLSALGTNTCHWTSRPWPALPGLPGISPKWSRVTLPMRS